MTDSGSPPYSQLVLEGINPALAAHLTILHNQLDGIADRQQKLIADLPEMINAEAAGALRQVITDLRDDSDFNRPLWASGFDHVAEHLGTDRGQKTIQSPGLTKLAEWWCRVQVKLVRSVIADWVLVVVLLAAGIGVVMLLANSGLMARALGVKP